MSDYEISIAEAWAQAYGTPQSDPHGVFAQLLGVDRNEAKEICYKYMWSEEGRKVFAVEQWHRTSQDGIMIYKFFSEALKNLGIDVVSSIPEIIEMGNP